MRRAEQDVEIGAIAFQQHLVRPRVRRAASLKIDVRRDDGARSLRRIAWNGQTRPPGRSKISLELLFQLGRSGLVNAAYMGRCTRTLPAEFQHCGILMLTKPRAIEIVMFIEHSDKIRQLVAHQERPELFAVSFLNIGEGVTPVELRKHKIPHR